MKELVLTYNLEADGKCDTNIPQKPLDCGCEDVIITLIDRDLTQADAKGIIRASIKSIDYPSEPTKVVNEKGKFEYYWVFTYTFIFNDDVLVDPDTYLRKCDIKHVCCYGCEHEFTEILLEDYVQSVTSPIPEVVDNTDPQNPILNVKKAIDVSDTPTVDMTYIEGSDDAKGIIYSDVIVSPDSDNILETSPNGLKVTAPEVDFPVDSVTGGQDCPNGYGSGDDFSVKVDNADSAVSILGLETPKFRNISLFTTAGIGAGDPAVNLTVDALGDINNAQTVLTSVDHLIVNPHTCTSAQVWLTGNIYVSGGTRRNFAQIFWLEVFSNSSPANAQLISVDTGPLDNSSSDNTIMAYQVSSAFNLPIPNFIISPSDSLQLRFVLKGAMHNTGGDATVLNSSINVNAKILPYYN